MRNAILGALNTLKSVAGVAATYSQNNDEILVTAIPGRTDYEAAGEDGLVIGSHAHDFIIKVEDLVLESTEEEVYIIPQRGDRISYIQDDKELIYEVLPIADELYRFTDTRQSAYRIHTKFLSSEEIT